MMIPPFAVALLKGGGTGGDTALAAELAQRLRFDTAQALTEEQKIQAQRNLGLLDSADSIDALTAYLLAKS